VELVDEPVAAGIAYGHKLFGGNGRWDSKELDEQFANATIMVYDLGGGTFDVTVMRLRKDGTFEVLVTAGDERLGGEDWDDILVDMLVESYERATGLDVRSSLEFMQELRLTAVEVKKALSAVGQVARTISFEGRSAEIVTKYGDFKRQTQHLTARTIDTIRTMFEQKEMDWNQIDRLLMVGGSSRLKAIQEHVALFSEKVIDMSLQPDTAVAHGAALYAAHQAGNDNVVVKKVVTVNSHALGLKVRDPQTGQLVNQVVLKANQPARTPVTCEYDVPPSKSELLLMVLVGDQAPDACVQLGQMRISKIPPKAKNPTIAVTYSFQDSGFLDVKAVVRHDGGEPIRAQAEIQVEGIMATDEVQNAALDLIGVEVQ